MTRTILLLVCAGIILPVTHSFAAINDDANGGPVFLQEEKAVDAAKAAGYSPTILESYADGTFLLTATKNGGSYDVKVTPNGQVIPVTPGPITPVSPAVGG